MDFDRLLSGYASKACILSVDALPNGYGNIRIVEGNKAHYDDMEKTLHRPFVPGSPYEMYFPQNKNFEDFCYRSAFQGSPMHAYVSLPQMGLWLNMFLLPLESDKENTGYCLYIYDVTPEADPEKRASVSADTSSMVLSTCIKLRGSNDLSKTLKEVIDDIREICDSDRCNILLVDPENEKYEVMAEAIRPGAFAIPMDQILGEEFYEIVMSWEETIGDSTSLIISNPNDMEWVKKVNPKWHASLVASHVDSIVLLPLKHNDTLLGYLWAVNFKSEDTVKIKETLELTAFFIAAEIANAKLLLKLEEMSTMDMLTGVKNRNAMNNVITDVIEGNNKIPEPYAVVFADLNGLKRVNDEMGHDKGDNLLKRAATVLRHVFTEAEVYRAGGDEFMLISPGTDEAKLEKYMAELENVSDEKNVSYAVGSYIVRDGEDIRKAMHVADERMYLCKKAYYEKYPERKYR